MLIYENIVTENSPSKLPLKPKLKAGRRRKK
jgi:hypothetical protein